MQRLILRAGIAAGLALAVSYGNTARAHAATITSTTWTARAADSGYFGPMASIGQPVVGRKAIEAIAGANDHFHAPAADAVSPASATKSDGVDGAHAVAPVDAAWPPSSNEGLDEVAPAGCDNNRTEAESGQAAVASTNPQPWLEIGNAQAGNPVCPDLSARDHPPALTTDTNTAARIDQQRDRASPGHGQPLQQCNLSSRVPSDEGLADADLQPSATDCASPAADPEGRVPRVHHVRVDLGSQQALPQTGISTDMRGELFLLMLGLFCLVAGIIITRYSCSSSSTHQATAPVLAPQQRSTAVAALTARPVLIRVRRPGAPAQRSASPHPAALRRAIGMLEGHSARIRIRRQAARPRAQNRQAAPPKSWPSRLHRSPCVVHAGGSASRFWSQAPPAYRGNRSFSNGLECWHVGGGFVPI